METIFHVKKKDTVEVMSGKDRGKKGKVLRVVHKTGRVVVEKVNVVKRHKKPTGQTAGGIVEQENPVPASIVLLFCEKCGKGTRTSLTKLDSGKKVRTCRKCKTQLDK